MMQCLLTILGTYVYTDANHNLRLILLKLECICANHLSVVISHTQQMW